MRFKVANICRHSKLLSPHLYILVRLLLRMPRQPAVCNYPHVNDDPELLSLQLVQVVRTVALMSTLVIFQQKGNVSSDLGHLTDADTECAGLLEWSPADDSSGDAGSHSELL